MQIADQVKQQGLEIDRWYTEAGKDPLAGIRFERRRSAEVTWQAYVRAVSGRAGSG